jgi:3-methyl-2-oxobutanoate hydroxymethyltransferase
MLGINQEFSPRFLRRYASIGDIMGDAFKHYIEDVKERNFPSEKEQY